MEAAADKRELRKQLREKLAGLSQDYLKQADDQITQNILALEEYRQATMIFCFVGVGREIDTRPLIMAALAAGKRISVPRCIAKGVMEAYEIQSFSDMQDGFYGLQEPAAHCPHVKPEAIDFALVPCLSCDLQGYRLGQGGGYYDRYLARQPLTGAVLCREAMLCPSVPHFEHDIALPLVITERSVYRIHQAHI